MKMKNRQQEILLFTGTTFSHKEWCLKDSDKGSSFFFSQEQLKNACWDGSLSEMLPESLQREKQLYLWQIYVGKSFLSIELSEEPQIPEPVFSIDPYLFPVSKNMN